LSIEIKLRLGTINWPDMKRKKCPIYIIYKLVVLYKWEAVEEAQCIVMCKRDLFVAY
jgi:hypothetical protein